MYPYTYRTLTSYYRKNPSLYSYSVNTKHTITQPTVIKSNENCIVFFDHNVMEIGEITRETNISSSPYKIFVNHTEEELRIINDKIPIISKISPNFKSYETSLNDIDRQINQVKDQHRIVSATEVAYSITKYAGYISLGILATYVLNKTRLLQLLVKILSNLNPFKTNNICIKIFC